MVEEIKPVVIENYEIEYRQISRSQKNRKEVSILGSVRILMRKRADPTVMKKRLFKCKVAECDPLEGNQSFSYGETPFR